MTDQEVIDLLKSVEHDSWCQECNVASTATALIKILNAHGMDVPEWVTSHAGDNSKIFEMFQEAEGVE